MALNFPLNPADGDTYENYVYDATEGVWNANPQQLASRFITSATQPSTPSNGDGWLDTNTGKTYIYYNDGSSAQWIESGNPVIGFVDPYDQDSTSTGYFSLPKGTSAQRPVAPSNGDIRFNTELGEPEYYSEVESAWFLFREQAISGFAVEFLTIGGGGGGGAAQGGGGAAGGYRSSVLGESTANGSDPEPSINISIGSSYTVQVGAGGAPGISNSDPGNNGSDSQFATITSLGGGGGGAGYSSDASGYTGLDGGSGGGGGWLINISGTYAGGLSTPAQGTDGGGGVHVDGDSAGGGGGGGALQAGQTAPAGREAGDGGNGISSSITGISVARAGGGGGGCNYTEGSGGLGGGGYGGGPNSGDPASGETNKGAGGGGGNSGQNTDGASGGSGIVIIKYPVERSISVDPGLVHTTNVVTFAGGDYKVTQFTAGTGTVTFS